MKWEVTVISSKKINSLLHNDNSIHHINKGRESTFKYEMAKTRAFLLVIIGSMLISSTSGVIAQEIPPVLEFPRMGLDDSTTYRGYTTRFFKDSEGNTLQISLNRKNGRVLNLLADAANESFSFTARNGVGQPADLDWLSESAQVSKTGQSRFVKYTLTSKSSVLHIGHFLLGSMRKERDFQYFKRHLQPFGSQPYIEDELIELIGNIEQLPPKKRVRHLTLLKAKDINELRSRLIPKITSSKDESTSAVLIRQLMFDGKNNLSLELTVDNKMILIDLVKDKILIRSLLDQPIQLHVKIGTDSPTLHPLQRDGIFNNNFFRFYERVKSAHDSVMHGPKITYKSIDKNEKVFRFQRLEDQVKSMELMCFQEKLLAGIPNYATYFGRDMIMSALMLEPILTSAMLEHVITSVLKKLSSAGEVSHEEGLGGQAIRENAAKYNKLLAMYFQHRIEKKEIAADSILSKAAVFLGNLQKPTENYHMVDDDFQLPVLVTRYLTRADIPDNRKRDFLQSAVGERNQNSRLTVLLRNLNYVAEVSKAYIERPIAKNLISFQKLEGNRWHAGSWRDSGVGYANGRFAMDINAIWVPKALEAIEKIFSTLNHLGITIEDLQTLAPEFRKTKLSEYVRDQQALKNAVKTWDGAIQHFKIHLSEQEVRRRIQLKLEWLPKEESAYWAKFINKNAADNEGIEFLALSLDQEGRSIPVASTDVATWVFLENLTEKILRGEIKPDDVTKRLKIFIIQYPIGLFLEGVGPVATNDAYASKEVWENFKRDIYHSPRTVWGREVNLFLLGICKQVLSAYDSNSQLKNQNLNMYVSELRRILDKIHTAVKLSGLKHNELWIYQVGDEKLLPVRYSTTTDIQLWNLTDLALQYLLERISNL
jgi:hypothetical protein